MTDREKLRRAWTVYCSDGEIWQDGLRKEPAVVEVRVADLECEWCEGPHCSVFEKFEHEAKSA